MSDRWLAGSAYEEFMGRWSRRLAPSFVSWLSIDRDVHWLDVGCGTGALTDAICVHAHPASVVGCDPAEALVEHARRRHVDPRVSFLVTGIGRLPTRLGGFESVTSAFALNFFPHPEAAIEEMQRVAAPGGLVSACVWDYADRMEFLRRFWDSAATVDRGARILDEARRFPICRPDTLEHSFRAGGLRRVAVQPIEITTRFASFADFWRPFLGATGPAPSYVAGLDADQRAALAEHLERSLPRQSDGSIDLIAGAWAVRGEAP